MEPVIEFTSNQEDVAPMYACGNCRMLWINTRENRREGAAKCCLCERCGHEPKKQHWTVCEGCKQAQARERQQNLASELEALPEVEDDGGPVYCEDNGKWYSELELFLDELHDGEVESAAVLHPSIVTKAPLPDVINYIEESISANFSGDYDQGPYLSKDDEERITAALDQIKLPDVWNANTKVRLRRSWLDRTS